MIELPMDTSRSTISQATQLLEKQQQRSIELRASPARERLERIARLASAVRSEADALRAALHDDLGKPAPESDLTELFPVLQEARYLARHLRRWMRNRHVMPTAATLGTRARVRYEPRGTSLIISPWNYPVNLTLIPVLDAFAAGCPVIVKPSEFTPATSACLRRLINSNFPPEDAMSIEGGVETAKGLLDLPFEHFFYTGGGRVAGEIMRAAARNLASVTLELGGKSPTVIDQSADLSRAARILTWAKFANAGQTCIAPDYVYVHAAIAVDFQKALLEEIARVWGSEPAIRRNNTDYCRIVSTRHTQRLTELLADARSRGARLLFGGEADPAKRYIEPTVVWNPPAGSQLMQEEIFGPILPLLPFQDDEEVIAAINSRPKPLALYIYARDRKFIRRIIGSTSSGGVVINHSMLHVLHERLPFGGVGASGLGSYHGFYGFRAFSHERAILEDKFSPSRILFPPYTSLPRRAIALLLKVLG